MLLQYLLFTFVILANFVLGAIVLARKYNKASGWLFGVAILSISLWAVGDMLLLGARSVELVEVGAYLFYIAPMTIPVTLWLFSLIFPEEGRLRVAPLLFGALSFISLGLVILLNLHWLVQSIVITSRLNIATPQTPGFWVYAAYLTFFFLLTYIALFKKRLKTSGRARLQVTYTMLGAVLAGVPALFTNLTLPLMGVRDLIWLGPIFSLLSVYCVMVAMVRHKMFDIRLLIARSLAYGVSLIALAGMYGFAVFVVANLVFGVDIAFKTQAALSILTAIVALTFGPIKAFFARRTNQLFYRDAYDTQAFFDDFNKALVSTIDLDNLLKNTTKTIETYLKAEYCVAGVKDSSPQGYRTVGTALKIFSAEEVSEVRRLTPRIHQAVVVTDDMAGEHEALRRLLIKNNIALLVRLTQDVSADHEGLGYIILGAKKSGNPYGGQDVKVLEAAANELVIAIQNATRFEEIEQFNVTLQEKVDQATRKLRRTNERLRILDQTKDDFISMASHQLRTPLTSVKGYVSMVLDGDGGKITNEQRRLLTQSFLSAQRMVYLISDLLNVSRLKTGKFVIEPVESNLAHVIEEEVEQLTETVKARGLELNYHKPERFPSLMVDETKLRQVIMNFIDNAIYYTPPGGHIDVYLVDKPESIDFTVVDDGIGVPKHEQHHLFSKFYRAKNAKNARPDGTGLGIFMAKKVIIAQGGAVIFKSAEGKGSTFGFTFPKAKLLPKQAKL